MPDIGTGITENLFGNLQKAQLSVLSTKPSSEAILNGENQVQEPVNQAGAQNGQKLKDSSKDYKARIFVVQFNPTEIVLQGSGGGLVPRQIYDSKDNNNNKLEYGSAPVNITFSTRLVFDHVAVGDAFTGVTSTSLSAAATRGFSYKSSQSSEKKRYNARGVLAMDEHSVRREVEALIGAIRSDDTRLINFSWGENLDYTGYLNSVNATYTMFNTSGEPIRAYVDLRILVADSEAADNDKLLPISNKDWFSKYKEAFGKSTSYVTTGQKLGSLLNLG